MREVAVAYREGQVAIDQALRREFENDLEKWDATIDAENLTFEFRSPEVLFEGGAIALRPRFAVILDDFFPRYLRVLRVFERVIDEVRVEGHTSSDWVSATEDEAYFNNMQFVPGAHPIGCWSTSTGFPRPPVIGVGLNARSQRSASRRHVSLWTPPTAKIRRRPGGCYSAS